jgi:hypothetical protein
MKRTKIWQLLGAILIGVTLLSACGGNGGDALQAPELPEDLESLVMLAKLDLSLKTGVNVDEIATLSVEEINFSDSSLGVREPGVEYAQVVTPGIIIMLEADGEEYEYHASGARVIQVPEPEF